MFGPGRAIYKKVLLTLVYSNYMAELMWCLPSMLADSVSEPLSMTTNSVPESGLTSDSHSYCPLSSVLLRGIRLRDVWYTKALF